MVQCHGYKNGKYQIFETEQGVKLDFRGPDADKFEQVNVPKRVRQVVKFWLTVKELRKNFPGFLPPMPNLNAPTYESACSKLYADADPA